MPKRRNSEARWIEARNRWQVNVTNEDGERKTFVSSKPGKKGKFEAERKADEWLEAGDFTQLRLNEAWERFVAYKKSTCSASWVVKLKSLYKFWINPTIGIKRLSRITPAEWKSCIINANEAGKSKKTLENLRGALTTFFAWCDENRIMVDKPSKIQIPQNAPVGERHILSMDDIRTLFTNDTILWRGNARKAFYIHAWRLIVILGLRRGELAGIQWNDIDGDGILHIRRSINSMGEITVGKTKNARRDILLPAHALRVIEDQKEMLKEYGIATRTWLFPSPNGDKMDTNALYKQWIHYGSQHGIKSTLHELRHTTVSLVKTELPEDLLKQMIGHSESMDTGRYKHRTEEDLEKTSNIVEGIFSRIL